MRIAVLVIGLALFLFVSVQSCSVMLGGELLADQNTADAGAVGLVLGLLFAAGLGFVMRLPLVSAAVFAAGRR
jgi:hypothetical protein